MIHYLDAFLCVGPPSSKLCGVLLTTIQHIPERFGISLAADKTEGPVEVIKFLGIEIDSWAIQCHLPDDKLHALQEEVRLATRTHKIQLHELQSLIDKLKFACRIMPIGRIFCRQLYAAMAGVNSPRHFIRLAREYKADVRVRHEFLGYFNSLSIWMEGPVSNYDLKLFTDAAGSTGYGSFLGGRWTAEWREAGLLKMLLELFPVVVAFSLWGELFRNKTVRLHLI